MPVHRSTDRATTTPTPSRTAENHSSRLVKLRSRIRKLMDQNLKDITGNRKAHMRWSAKGYARHVVIRGGKMLRGWLTHAGVPFCNLSDVPGGQLVMELLLALWTSAVLPGVPLDARQPAAVESIRGAEDSDDPIEEAVWSSEVEGEASEINELAD